MSPGGYKKGGRIGPDVLYRLEQMRRAGEREDGGGWCVQRMLYVSVSAVDSCCSVLARQ